MYMDNEKVLWACRIKFWEFGSDPNTNHGNVINETTKTRVSINIRIKNWFTPDLADEAPDRQFGVYYEDLCFSESTLRAFKILSNGNIK